MGVKSYISKILNHAFDKITGVSPVMDHVMLDIETMGNGPEAAVMSIGACYFNPATGAIGETFHEHISLETSVKAGLKMDASTVIWWMGQSDAARSKFKDNGKQQPIGAALLKLQNFMLMYDDDVKVWGNGSTFDNAIIKNAYSKALLMDPPWAFWNDRDVRTVVEMGQAVGFDPKRDMAFEGVKHDALADAIHQAKYVSLIWQKLTGVKI